EQEAPALPGNRRQHGTCVTRQLVGDAVAYLAGELVEGDEAAAVSLEVHRDFRTPARTAADVDQEQVAFNDRRAADAEEVLHDAEVGAGVHLPDGLAVQDPHAMEYALGTVDVDAVAVDDRAAARAVVVVVKVLVIGRVIKSPQYLAGFALEGGEA